MRRVSSFTEKDGALNRKLLELEQNAVDATDKLDREKPSFPKKLLVTKTGQLVRVGQLMIVDSASALELLLAKPTDDDETRELLVVKRQGSAALTLRGINTTVNNSAAPNFTNAGLYRLVVALGAYWMAP